MFTYAVNTGLFIFQIYRKTYGQHVGFKMFTDSILLALTRKVSVTHTDNIYIYLYINLRRSRDGTFVRACVRRMLVVVIHSVRFGQLLR